MKRYSPRVATIIAVAGIVLLASSCSNEPTAPPQGQRLTPQYRVDGSGRPTEEGVIVLLRDRNADPRAFAQGTIATGGGRLRFLFNHGTKGFSAILPSLAVDALRRNPAVRIVEPIQQVDVAAGCPSVGWATFCQPDPTWGLDRIDQRALPLGGTYNFNERGDGVTVYVFDTGILTTHSEFGGRAAVLYDLTGGNGQDCYGHGTHVAGIIGGSTY